MGAFYYVMNALEGYHEINISAEHLIRNVKTYLLLCNMHFSEQQNPKYKFIYNICLFYDTNNLKVYSLFVLMFLNLSIESIQRQELCFISQVNRRQKNNFCKCFYVSTNRQKNKKQSWRWSWLWARLLYSQQGSNRDLHSS